ncbi:MAG: hypothetical protein IJW28_02820 [Clostridia bacterium]|nr:hypothetical protein [Clostridia bacterium]
MLFFNKKSKTDEILTNKAFIAKMANSVDVLISLVDEEEKEVISGLRHIQDEIKYLNPSRNSDVIAWDEKINNKLADIKLAIVQAKKMLDYCGVKDIINEMLNDTIPTRISKEQ